MKNLKKALIGLSFLTVLFFVLINLPENRKAINSPHFNFLFSSPIDSSDVVALAEALESNYNRIGKDLQTAPSGKIEVNLYGERWRFIKATKNWGGSGNIEGLARMHFMQQAWGESDSKKVAIHEFAHTVVLKLLLDQEPTLNAKAFDRKFANFPRWLWEAISVYEAQQFVNPKTLSFLGNGKYPSLNELNNTLKGGKIYSCGFTIVEYIRTRYGQGKLIELIKNYGNIEKVFHVTENQFSRDWYLFLKDKYL